MTGGLVEHHDEWKGSAERRSLNERSMALTANRSEECAAKHRTHDGVIGTTNPHRVENYTSQRDVTSFGPQTASELSVSVPPRFIAFVLQVSRSH